jgi:hypothetical protein
MRFFPYHDAGGLFWPELDTRHVGLETLSCYLGLGLSQTYQRVINQDLGPLGKTPAAGLWVTPTRGKNKRARYTVQPATLWRLRGLGRYALPGFDPQRVQVRLYHWDPEETRRRAEAALSQGHTETSAAEAHANLAQQVGQAVAAAIAGLRPLPSNVVPFPAAIAAH